MEVDLVVEGQSALEWGQRLSRNAEKCDNWDSLLPRRATEGESALPEGSQDEA